MRTWLSIDVQVPESKGSYTDWNDPENAVTILQVGSAAGCNGSHILLVEGKSIQYKALKDIVKTFGCPPGSCVIPTPTDDAWEEVVLPHLIEGIRQMPVIRNYLEFKCMVTFDWQVSSFLLFQHVLFVM